ncbi:hypothetical protein HIM_08731 [Hirsutella minnesotensis 3608]|uniref:PPPDE domain-containing protein n=1 Tax=Hirsutella minnesotensis 3608 TaxID=1043627 RepID=A0A0F7ZH22_9HYPO|nr:hypothetical protein HIM_08731 [Hirsutella minnesotensis 3608]
MDVHLLVYDLSRGLARQMSMGILGFQLDAIYHTSIQLNGREYVYDGGIIAITPGSSHLGQPMQKLHLGTTNLPMDAYDLFRHNCNNFTDSFANFLIGKGIPSHISNMPQAVLESPMGRMLFSQLTQGVNASRSNGSILGLEQSAAAPPSASPNHPPRSRVVHVRKQEDLSKVLDDAKRSCAVVFFTSATCPPCKALYPVYDELADEFGDRAFFVKVDVSQPQAAPIGQAYSISSTPTFITFLKGQQENRWSGADRAGLRGNIQLLVQMAHPAHPHTRLRLPTFSNPDVRPVLFAKLPPAAKLAIKMGDEIAGKPEVKSLIHFIEARNGEGASNARLPDMRQLSEFMQSTPQQIPLDKLFTVVDLFRCALVDPRMSGYYAEERGHETIHGIFNHANTQNECPYALRLVTLQLGCNLFSTPLFGAEILGDAALRTAVIRLISSSFLDDSHNNIRVASSSLLYNLALADRRQRTQDSSRRLPEADQVELAASVLEAISQEDKSVEALQGMLSALGHLVYGLDLDGELADLLRAMDAQGTVSAKRKTFANEKMVAEVADELLGKGLARK